MTNPDSLDLTEYRRASREIREFVGSFIWGRKVEKLGNSLILRDKLTSLGLDELFLDVTNQVNNHLQNVLKAHPSLNSEQIFQIDSPPSSRFFSYPFGTANGFLEPPGDSTPASVIAYSTLQLFAASHFAHHIRSALFSTLGYTTSAGISSTKLLSKLLSDLHKPALQSVHNPNSTPAVQQSFLDSFKVEKLTGFGFRTGHILRNKILGEEMPEKGTYGEADKHNGSFVNEYSQSLLNDVPEKGTSLSVGQVRTSTTLNEFLEWFGQRLGPRLWELLHGIDNSEVLPSPDFPKQISVEDSYPDNWTLETMFQNLKTLTKSIIRRLDLELQEEGTYVRFPKTIRLSMRNGWQNVRESKSARIPVELFDLSLPTEKRVEAVLGIVGSLGKHIVAGWAPGWKIGVINVCVTDLVEEKPERGIKGFIGQSRKEEEIDWDFIRELPEDIKMDVLQQYHLSPEKLLVERSVEEGDGIVGEEMAVEGIEMDPITLISDVPVDSEIDDEWDNENDEDGEFDDTRETCEICGCGIYPWMVEAHIRYHQSPF